MIPLPEAFLTRPLAHQALHDKTQGRPENSRAAIRAAIAAGYGIEIDLQLSRDGRAMVFHDYDLGRLTGISGAIQQRDASELEQITLTHGDEGIPTLAEVLTLVAGRTPLLIELKDQHGQMGETDGRLEQAVAEDLRGYGGPAALMSFNPNMIARLAGLSPNIPRGLVTESYSEDSYPMLREEVRDHLKDIPDYDRVGASFISHQVSDLRRPRVAALKADGAHILCWTVRSTEQEAEARQIAENITFEGYLAQHPT